MLDRVKMYCVMVLQVQCLWQKKGTSFFFQSYNLFIDRTTLKSVQCRSQYVLNEGIHNEDMVDTDQYHR